MLITLVCNIEIITMASALFLGERQERQEKLFFLKSEQTMIQIGIRMPILRDTNANYSLFTVNCSLLTVLC